MEDEQRYSPCVRSGFCCKTAICGWGETNESGGCKYLITKIQGEGYEFFECGHHDWIIQQPGSEMMPAFGVGCCMNMNTFRHANIKALLDGRVDPARIGLKIKDK